MIIDISNYQGNVDFAKVKNEVEGVIIRCGWGSDYKKQDDPKFNEYVKGCIENNIPFGIYLYSYAKTISQAQSEAKHVMRLCDPIKDKLTYPVFYDLEQNGTQSGAVDRARAWAKVLTDNGYKVGIYANSNWWNNYLKGLDEFPKWVANYGTNDGKPHTKPSNSNMIMWQYTSRGKVAGINGNVDCNLYYGEAKTVEKPVEKKKSNEEIAKEVLEGKWGNGIDRKKRLTEAGYNYNAIQSLVNNLAKKETTITYTVRRGDTLTKIAKEHNTTVSRIVKLNNLKNPNKIYVGEVLIIAKIMQ